MKKLFIFGIFSVTFFSLAYNAVTFAAPARSGSSAATSPLGIDISWPQCGKKLPTDPAFVVVGVNGGLATTVNSCLASQLSYAKNTASGALTSQPAIQLYVNTANPGGLSTSSWPKNNIDPLGNASSNPYLLSCDGSDSLACAWQYGWNRAVEDVNVHFKPAATTAKVSTSTSSYIWWLDVETENTWKTGKTTFDYASNTAVLEGMAAYFLSQQGKVGLYSTGWQWSQIVGNGVSPTSNLNGLKYWRPGGASLSTAKDACKATPLTTNGTVGITQFISKNIDYNYACI